MSEERKRKIEVYGKAYEELAAGLKRFPREMWGFKPSARDWSIHEILIHIADSEANSYVRCRRFIAEPGSGVYGYDGDQWAAALNYAGQDADEAIDLFRVLRSSSHHLIKDLPDGVWSNTVEHSESGAMTMDRWLDIYARHVTDHVAQMQTVYDAWTKRKS